MALGVLRRIRYEVARRLNRYRPGNRWTQATIGKVQRVVTSTRTFDLRAGSSDFNAFLEVFDGRFYDSSQFPQDAWIQAEYEAIREAGQTPLIIDAGANIGMTALFFADRFPDALVVAIEPEPANFNELVRHCKDSPNIRPLHAALASADGTVSIVDPGLGEWGFRTKEGGDTPAYSIETLASEGAPFIIKVDIEGFEKDIFNPQRVDMFCAVFIEPHDAMLPGEGTLDSFLRSHAALQRDLIISGLNLISVRRPSRRGDSTA